MLEDGSDVPEPVPVERVSGRWTPAGSKVGQPVPRLSNSLPPLPGVADGVQADLSGFLSVSDLDR